MRRGSCHSQSRQCTQDDGLLSSTSAQHTRKCDGNARTEAEEFVKEIRKILRRSERGKELLNILEEATRSPRMKGLSETHKQRIPMCPLPQE